MAVGIGLFLAACGIWVTIGVCNWCSCCPLYKKRKIKEIAVNVKKVDGGGIKTGEKDKNGKENGKGRTGMDFNSPPPKYGEKRSLPHVWT